jgi:HAD superfamily hydrolase (TIGR01509 family)
MDGVLIDSTEIHFEAWKTYLAQFGHDPDWVLRNMLGKRNDQIVHAVFGDDLNHSEVAHHGAEKERLYRQLMAPVVADHLVPGVVEFVKSAHEAGIPCGLGTNAEPANVDFVLEAAGLRQCFSAVVDGHQVTNAKPHPEIYLTAAERLGQAPERCVVFEDSPGGMAAARAAGMKLVALLTTLNSAPDADLAIPNFRDPSLERWLGNLAGK